MAFDSHANFVSTLVQTAPSPAVSGTSLTVSTGSGTLFPATPFNCVIYPVASFPTKLNTEIVRVTSIVGDVLTITRAQEASTAQVIAAGNIISLTITAKTLTDVENSVAMLYNSGSNNSSSRYTPGIGWQFYNSTTGLWHALICTGNPPTTGWDAGSV